MHAIQTTHSIVKVSSPVWSKFSSSRTSLCLIKMTLSEEQIKQFYEDGYLVLPEFAGKEIVEELKKECHRLVDEMKPEEHNTVFSTLEMKRTSDDYFMTSGDKIRYFFEDGAKDEKGTLKVDKHLSLNKIGHGEFIVRYFECNKNALLMVKGVAKSLGLIDPVICQSMYIFKQPGIGGEVIPHQDSTFLHTDPMKLIGFWIALEDATLDNGCLWFIPGSHKAGLYGNRRMIRFPNRQEGDPETTFTGERVTFDDSKYIAAPVKKGTMVIIHGEVVHKSERNTSPNSRHIYTFHMYEKHNTKYSEENWLQAPKENPFPKLYI